LISNQQKWNTSKYTLLSLLALGMFLSVLSNFRTRIVLITYITSSFAYISWKYFKKNKLNTALIKKGFYVFLSILITAIYLSYQLFGFTIIDRLLLKESDSFGSIQYRIQSTKTALMAFTVSPIIGVGLGNYGLYNRYQKQSATITKNQYRSDYNNAMKYTTHNFITQSLAETGITGTILLIGFFLHSFKLDLDSIKRLSYSRNYNKVPFIISFWSIFIIMFLNPSHTINIIGWLLFTRALIDSNVKTNSRNHP